MWILELVFAFVITYFFIKREKPKTQFLIYGYIFFLVSLLLQIPLKLFLVSFQSFFQGNIIPLTILTTIIIIIPPITKYFSLKRFLKTKSYKNGILFGIGWATLESINLFKEIFLTFILTLLTLELNTSLFLNQNLTFFHFVFFFITNLAITVLIIISIIRKKKIFFFISIFLNIALNYGVLLINETIPKIIFYTIFISYSLIIIFQYKKIKNI